MTSAFEKSIGYSFKQRDLLVEALTHSSAGMDSTMPVNPARRWNERLEFLGDAVLSLGISTRLFAREELFKEGDLSRIRAALVNEGFLAGIARRLRLGDEIQLGRGERKAGLAEQDSILADALEAVLGAVYLDGGFDAARFVVDRLFQEELEGRLAHLVGRDFKTELQELVQGLHKERPEYVVVGEEGPPHARTFTVSVSVLGREMGQGCGVSKKAASQMAAQAALGKFEGKVQASDSGVSA
ncbi:MAG: hypothetical protein RIQ81_2261 [Pseudomonadota bacterium]